MSRLQQWWQRWRAGKTPASATVMGEQIGAEATPYPEGRTSSSAAQATTNRWQSFRDKLPAFIREAFDNAQPRAAESVTACTIEGKHYLFGLEWRLIPPTRALVRTLSLAKKEGQTLYVISEMEDIIGVGNLRGAIRGARYSAAMHLASRFSQGGLELYAFELPTNQIAVIALNESRPIPGFDYLGDRETARGLIDEFLAIQIGQLIRQVGNAGLLDAEESVAPEDLFASPAKSAKVKTLSSGRSTKWLLALAVLVMLIVGGVQYWMEQERQRLLEENRRAVETPAVLYQRSLSAALNRLPPSGEGLLDGWRDAVRNIPLQHKGWRLIRVECQHSECKAQWDRVYGNFSDFMNALPANAIRSEEVQIKNNPAQSSILTWHAATRSANTAKIEQDALPTMRAGLRSLSDHLQDISLLGNAEILVDKPALFGGDGNPEELPNPVLSGTWSIHHELWLMPYVKVSEHCIVESLVIELFNAKGESEQRFKIKGSYYVQSASKS